MADPLIYVRAIHFAATITLAGVVFFVVCIAGPVFRDASARVRLWLAWIVWSALLLAVLSGAAWFVLVAQSMSGQPLADIFSGGILWTVLSQTGFGRDWLLRFALACLLAILFALLLSTRGIKSVWIKSAVVTAAAGLVGTLAWAGHAVGGPGMEGIVHAAADVLHLIAAAAWVGALVPLALLLLATGRDARSVAGARAATVRFSTFGIASVGTLLVTGAINTWYLVGSVHALADTDYGRLVLTKVALFLGMVAIAAVNRLRLTPRLVGDANAVASANALRQLRRNVVIEVLVGAVIIAIVAVLGVTPPGAHEDLMPHAHHHSH